MSLSEMQKTTMPFRKYIRCYKNRKSSLILNKERFSLCDIISNTVEDCKSQIEKVGKQREISLLYENNNNVDSEKQGIIFVKADKTRLTQVISNLLSNAIKFTERGTITITNSTATIVEDNKQRQEVAIVSISDTGKGIDPPRLFFKICYKV
jgi:signal transduction histidine kinase